jgi:serine-type D-Ala-D-Ala carboxypeptidase (penicillin-binding protein 5/6)
VTTSPFLDTPARKRRRAIQRRRRARRRLAVLVLGLSALLCLGVFVATADHTPRERPSVPEQAGAGPSLPEPAGQAVLGPLPGTVDLADTRDPVRVRFKRPPRSALLVNLDTGDVLWRHRPEARLPIASLTKMMTALVAVDALGPRAKARITPTILNYRGSGMGVLPRGRRVRTETLLNGLMLPSGNDAARALAFRVAGGIGAFVERMNAKAAAMGLGCTRFASVEGLSAGNRSCPRDLAVMAKAVLDTPRLARIVRRRRAILPFPIKGGRVHLYNSNPLLRQRYRGAIGVKTGYTRRAGRCLVVAARRRGVRLAAILLDSSDPGRQGRQLLDRGFRALR